MKFIFICLFISFNVFANSVNDDIQKYLGNSPDLNSTKERLIEVSKNFIDTPFEYGPAGEGKDGYYDTKPLYRLDAFDCVTYVETTLAMAFMSIDGLDNHEENFKETFVNIKYNEPNKISYTNRNHFTSINWIPNAINKLFLKDVTQEISPDAGRRMKWLNVTKWYEDKINAVKDDPKKVEELESESKNKEMSNLADLDYIPLKEMLSESIKEKIIEKKILVFSTIKNEHTKVNIPVIVSHIGFIVARPDNTLVFRHASISKKKVTEETLYDDYINERLKDETWPTLGFHLMDVVEDL